MHSQDYCTIDNIQNDLCESLEDCKEIYDFNLRVRCENYISMCIAAIDRVLKGMGE